MSTTRGKSPATNRNSADTRNVSKWKGQNACEKKNARNKLLVVSTRNIPPASNRGEEGRRGKNTVLCQSLKVLIETNVIYKGL